MTKQKKKSMLRSFEKELLVGENITTCAIYIDDGCYTGQWRMSDEGLHKHGLGVLKYTDCHNDSFTYTGRFENDQMTTGVLDFEIQGVSKTYEGEFREGRFEGYGNLNDNGLRYEGQFFHGESHGLGKLTLANNNECEGEFFNGMANGVALQVIKSSLHTTGLTYVGGFVDGLRHGYAIAKFGEKATYVGQFENDVRCGQGMMFFNDQKGVIFGEWFEDQVTGVCETISVVGGDVQYYEGILVDDRRHGTGKLISKGMIYEGEFRDGYYEGIGKISEMSGKVIYEGSWEEGKPHGEGRETLDRGMYTGMFVNSHKQGIGEMVYEDGSFYKGMWNKGEREGDGFFMNAIGDTFSGLWKQDTKHGEGVYTDTAGVRYEGMWEKDLLHGRCVTISDTGCTTNEVWKHGVKVACAFCV